MCVGIPLEHREGGLMGLERSGCVWRAVVEVKELELDEF